MSRYLVMSLFLILSMPLTTRVCAGDSDIRLSLSGSWKIHLGDNGSWAAPTLDDEGWDTLVLPGSYASYAREHGKGSEGFVWVRKKVLIPGDFKGKDMGIFLGYIAQADEVFFNGEKIGGEDFFPPHEISKWNFPRHYFVPRTAIKAGEANVIAVRIWFHTFGDMTGNPYISGTGPFKKHKANAFFSRIIMNYVIIAMGLPLLILSALFAIQRPRQPEYLLYTLQLACGFFIIYDMCSFWRFPGGIGTAFKSVAFSWTALNVVHPIFLHRLYGFERKKTETVLIGYLLFCLPFLFFVKSSEFRLFGMIVTIVASSIGFYNLSCHISALFYKKPYARSFSLFGLTVVAGAIHDGVIYMSKLTGIRMTLFGYAFDTMIFPYTAAALFLGTALILVQRFIDILKTNEDLNENLEHKVEERTRSLILLTEELEHQNIRLEDMAIRDGLTGLYNHRALFDRLDEIFMTSRKNRAPMAVVMIDVDDFKGFNDTYGHQAGDQVLVAIADILKTSIREYDLSDKFHKNRMADNRDYDLAGRYGGDEFVMVLPQCGKDMAVRVTERICDQVRRIRIPQHPDLKISGSFGVAVLQPDVRCPDSEKLITLADLALYKSKSLGKNQVHCKIYEDR